MTKDEKALRLGHIGENIVANWYSSQGYRIKLSLDPYDSVKDLMVGHMQVEVKTQQPYVKMKALTFRPNQLPKCSNPNTLLNFVTATAEYDPLFKWNNCLFEVDHNFKTIPYTTSYGIKMIAVPIEQEAVRFIKKLEDEEIYVLSKYTQSNYVDGRKVQHA
jgi:hypothetical protein